MSLCKIEALSERERERRWLRHNYNDITSLSNLLAAWPEFLAGKKGRKDVGRFSVHLTDNILDLQEELVNKTYQHGSYQAFKINDPKPRDIHKATVRDRLVHHAIYRILYPLFEQRFSFDSYSCRLDKGTHKAINRFRDFARRVSENNHKTVWVLKCDIRKFFASIDHEILLDILNSYIADESTIWLLEQVIKSFMVTDKAGLPLGNLTSQLLVNVYMNEFDQFVKRGLKVKYYVRYADDFVALSADKTELERLLPKFAEFLENKLKLRLHPGKCGIKTLASGIDFLGWVHFPTHRVLRPSTRRRMARQLKIHHSKATRQSYSGLTSHGNCYKIRQLLGLSL